MTRTLDLVPVSGRLDCRARGCRRGPFHVHRVCEPSSLSSRYPRERFRIAVSSPSTEILARIRARRALSTRDRQPSSFRSRRIALSDSQKAHAQPGASRRRPRLRARSQAASRGTKVLRLRFLSPRAERARAAARSGHPSSPSATSSRAKALSALLACLPPRRTAKPSSNRRSRATPTEVIRR